NAPRFDYGMFPGGRTNWIKNSTMVGAKVGTPPTGWGVFTGTISGVTCSVVGTGVESGFPYVDLSFSGSPTVTGVVFRWNPYTNGDIPGYKGQTWVLSMYARLVQGTLGDASLQLVTGEEDRAFTITNQTISPGVSLASGRGGVTTLQQFSQTYTNT